MTLQSSADGTRAAFNVSVPASNRTTGNGAAIAAPWGCEHVLPGAARIALTDSHSTRTESCVDIRRGPYEGSRRVQCHGF